MHNTASSRSTFAALVLCKNPQNKHRFSGRLSLALELENMDIASLIIIGVTFIIWLWLVMVAIVALRHDNTLEPFQRKAQMLIVLLVPFFGSALIIHLVKEHYPEAIPQAIIPWPCKSLIFGKPAPVNKNSNNNEESGIDLAIRNGQHSHNDYSGGVDGGGSD